MKPITLPDRLKLVGRSVKCDACHTTEAVWSLDGTPTCSVCYLYSHTEVGGSEAFRAFLFAVEDERGYSLVWDGGVLSQQEADRILGALVLTSLRFEEVDNVRDQ